MHGSDWAGSDVRSVFNGVIDLRGKRVELAAKRNEFPISRRTFRCHRCRCHRRSGERRKNGASG